MNLFHWSTNAIIKGKPRMRDKKKCRISLPFSHPSSMDYSRITIADRILELFVGLIHLVSLPNQLLLVYHRALFVQDDCLPTVLMQYSIMTLVHARMTKKKRMLLFDT